MIDLKKLKLLDSLSNLSTNKNSVQINTINAHSYNVAKHDKVFSDVLMQSDYLLPDGQSIVWAKYILSNEKLHRITGFDLFEWEMNRINEINGRCFFLGSTNEILQSIKDKALIEYPNIEIDFYSPPYKEYFSEKENHIMIERINLFNPNVLFVGMTAPKQEKWVAENINSLYVNHICSIGAVFNFYAGNIKRAPRWMQNIGFEWLYRLTQEPKRMWKRYIIGNIKFTLTILKEKYRNE